MKEESAIVCLYGSMASMYVYFVVSNYSYSVFGVSQLCLLYLSVEWYYVMKKGEASVMHTVFVRFIYTLFNA